MNLDIFASTVFGDADGIRSFMLAHRFIHDAEAVALNKKFNVPVSTFGMSGGGAEQAWIDLMLGGRRAKTPPSLRDWLNIHANVHTQTYSLIGGTVQAPDLSVVDFSSPDDFYDWMYAHQVMHDFEQKQLGLS